METLLQFEGQVCQWKHTLEGIMPRPRQVRKALMCMILAVLLVWAANHLRPVAPPPLLPPVLQAVSRSLAEIGLATCSSSISSGSSGGGGGSGSASSHSYSSPFECGSLFLGMDLSTQSLKCTVLDKELAVVHTAAVNFGASFTAFSVACSTFVVHVSAFVCCISLSVSLSPSLFLSASLPVWFSL